MNGKIISRSVAIGFCLSGLILCACAQQKGAESSSASVQPVAIDLKNTVCPVSGDPVGDSKLTETYQGKIYHFCCDDCPAKFKADPAKYAAAVAADPAKYGVK